MLVGSCAKHVSLTIPDFVDGTSQVTQPKHLYRVFCYIMPELKSMKILYTKSALKRADKI